MPDIPKIFGQRSRTSVGGSSHKRDKTRSYQRLCADILTSEPLCRYCRARGHITAAAIVDHIVALSIGGSNSRDNLAPACRDCNAAKAVDEQRFLGRGYDPSDIERDPALGQWLKLARPVKSDLMAGKMSNEDK